MKNLALIVVLALPATTLASETTLYGSAGVLGELDVIGFGATYTPGRVGLGITFDYGQKTSGGHTGIFPDIDVEKSHFEREVFRLGVSVPYKVNSIFTVAPNIGVTKYKVTDTYTRTQNGVVVDSYDNSYDNVTFSPGVDVFGFLDTLVIGASLYGMDIGDGYETFAKVNLGYKF
ncbi:hypothetical protein VPHD377_0084 [Vibrio phage D377]